MKGVLEEELKRVKLSSEERKKLFFATNKIIAKINEKVKNKGIDASVFLGGSLAKDTILKKDRYDIDIFIRFNAKYSEKDIEKNLRKIFFWFKITGMPLKIKKLHGSRDYYQIMPKNSNIIIEAVPTIRINRPEEARNVTDLSYFHVKYINDKLKKNKKLADEIILAKVFCHAQKVYGAESYVKGLSGYALELLVCHYSSFIKFLNGIAGLDSKGVIDPGNHYKTIEEILNSLNKAKIESPIIIIDPTFKERNAASSLSKETLDKLKISAKAFLQNPGIEFFEEKKIVKNDLIRKAKEEDGVFSAVEIQTNKQEGDIAGTKLLKFSKILSRELARYINIIEEHFEYGGEKKAVIYYILKKKNEIIIEGPSLEHKEAVENFKKAHPIWYIKNKRIKSSMDADIKTDELIKNFIRKNKKQLREMAIKKIRIL